SAKVAKPEKLVTYKLGPKPDPAKAKAPSKTQVRKASALAKAAASEGEAKAGAKKPAAKAKDSKAAAKKSATKTAKGCFMAKLLSGMKPRPGGVRNKKRWGRGDASGQGGTSTKGHKGQRAGAGGYHKGPTFEGGQMPLVRRVPKRG